MTMADNPAWIFLITTSCFILGVSAQVQSDLCPEPCIDRTCQNQHSYPECTYGCVDGYWGTRCYQTCPVNCATCHRQFGARIENRECYTFQDGFYNNATATECTLTCLSQCRSCNNESDCTACSDSFYLDNSQCKPCPERCAECTSNEVCTACASEYYTGTLCEICVVGRFGDTYKAVQSDLCPETCVDRTCQDPDSYPACTYGCVDGYWGNRCYQTCPVNCATCHRQFAAQIENRECYTCQDGFYNNATAKECTLTCLSQCRTCNNESDCTACSDGFYLEKSQCKPCPERCAECTSDDVCKACTSDFYTGVVCETCVYGRLGDKCESVRSDLCPENCVDRTCEDNNQNRCTYGCVDGFWGNTCNNECPTRCTACHREFGVTRQCDVCHDDFYITDSYTECTLSCHPYCKSCITADLCQVCKSDHYNSESVTNCSLTRPPCPPNCESCLSESECAVCKDGFYNTATVKDCSNSCPAQCLACISAMSCTSCVTNCKGPLCQECAEGMVGESCKKDATALTNGGTIAGIAVGGTIGLAIVVLLIVIIKLMYKRYDQTRAKKKRTEDNGIEPPRSIYDDLKMEGLNDTNGDYDCLDEESRIRDNEPGNEETISHQYINIAV